MSAGATGGRRLAYGIILTLMLPLSSQVAEARHVCVAPHLHELARGERQHLRHHRAVAQMDVPIVRPAQGYRIRGFRHVPRPFNAHIRIERGGPALLSCLGAGFRRRQ